MTCPVCDEELHLRQVTFSEAGWACVVCNCPHVGYPPVCHLGGTGVTVARRYWLATRRPVFPAYFDGEPEYPIETESDVKAWAVFTRGLLR